MDNIFVLFGFSMLLGASVYFGVNFFRFRNTIELLQKQVEEYEEALEKGQNAIELALNYEDFYNSTVGDMGEIVDRVGELVKKRQMLSDDPDVQNLVRLLAIAHNTLLRYINAKSSKRNNESGTEANNN